MELTDLKDATESSQFGGKAANLAKLLQAELPVPNGLAIGLTAFDQTGKLQESVKQQLNNLLDQTKLYAVRSSALAEDAEGASWAGQFETFLDTRPADVVIKIEECHNSNKSRAMAYASHKDTGDSFSIAVVVQEMVKPDYAGVLFTNDPVTGRDTPITEYVTGLGEELVSGRADPVRMVLDASRSDAPFDVQQLIALARQVEQLFGVPQDIEWASADGKIWLTQARPITTSGQARQGYNLGNPQDLFYWGPSRATPLYMGDFMAGVQRLFAEMADSDELPTPPPTLVLFDMDKMVWLNNAREFGAFVDKTFAAYIKRNALATDIQKWLSATEKLTGLSGQAFNDELINAWYYTELPEFSLYGAEAFISKQLSRFDDRTLPKIWGAFTINDKPTFLSAFDEELSQTKDAVVMAKKYPWIRDGYGGPNDEAQWYFQKRLEAIERDGLLRLENNEAKRQAMITEYGLTDQEVSMLTLTRELAEFMDDRKQWMMRTRRLITDSLTDIDYGWYFDGNKSTLIDEADTHELWQRYVDFKSASSTVTGTVANTGGRHFVSGEVAVLNSHTDPAENDKILVVPSTSPGWVPLMRRARALVTDHGGMMSHAAIVAREFNLPCIVGTQQGTKVLQNGNRVILDLVKGEIIS